jgi:hypothetical protein
VDAPKDVVRIQRLLRPDLVVRNDSVLSAQADSAEEYVRDLAAELKLSKIAARRLCVEA